MPLDFWRQVRIELDKIKPVFLLAESDSRDMLYAAFDATYAWDATARERFGPATDDAIMLFFVSEGIPMMYNEQQAGDPKRLAFFEKDPIPWRKDPMEALWNAPWSGEMIPVANSRPQAVLTFLRRAEDDEVFAAFNFSPTRHSVTISGGPQSGSYVERFSKMLVAFDGEDPIDLPAWSWRVYERRAR
ncbi:MAG: alpha amylase C-terminal domain-containing protein [Hyphomonadaceae bacterium]|nr:alpha amylase C-terminal domain-containing protein [Hyphomonadaceae bacterium]